MRICFVATSFDRRRLAGGYRAGSLVKYLAREGCELDLVGAEPDDAAAVGPAARLTVVPYPARLRSRSLPWRIVNRGTSWSEPERLWARRALPVVLASVTAHVPDALIVSSPPHSAQLIGARVAAVTAIPYFADLRDDWVSNGRARRWTPVHRATARWDERRIVEAATLVFANTPVVGARLVDRHPDHASKISVLPNGYEDADFLTPPGGPLVQGKLAAVYAGGGDGGYAVEELGRLARDLLSSGLDAKWHILTAGFRDVPVAAFGRVWTHLGVLPPAEAATVMQQADLLLLLKPPGGPPPSGDVPLKTYSYLRSGSPVLYLGEEGAATMVLRRFEGVFTLPREQRAQLAAWLGEREPELRRRPRFARPGIAEFDFSVITRRLLNEVRGASARRGSVPGTAATADST